ncbi:hypothetical protein D3C71_936620 [compost metagenome]
MPRTAHDRRRDKAADDEAGRPGGAQKAQNFIGVTFRRTTDGQDETLKAVAEKKKQSAG